MKNKAQQIFEKISAIHIKNLANGFKEGKITQESLALTHEKMIDRFGTGVAKLPADAGGRNKKLDKQLKNIDNMNDLRHLITVIKKTN